jgi:hypothetical protein
MAKPKKRATKRPKKDDYDAYEKKCEAIRAENEKLLTEFAALLAAKKLSASTIKDHRANVDAYINMYLLFSEPTKARDGADGVGGFFGDWFPRKCMWANPTSMKSLAASLKKFYGFMFEKGEVTKEQFDELRETIKDELPDWLDALREDDDPDDDDPLADFRRMLSGRGRR